MGQPSDPPDIEKARQMIKDAGVAGEEMTVYGNNDDPTDKVTEAYADQLTKLGFKAKPKILDGGVYFQTIGSAKEARRRASPTGSGLPAPEELLLLVDGESIQPTNNQNFGNVGDPEMRRGS